MLDRTEVLGEDGTAYAYCVISDITPQHTLKAYYENILDCLPTPLIVTDRRNRLRLLNNSALHLIGKPAGELLGRNSDTLYQGDKPSYVERDGRCYKVDYSHLYDADGREDAHIAVMSDITALREMDDSLKSLAKKIPGGVCEVAFAEDFTLLYLSLIHISWPEPRGFWRFRSSSGMWRLPFAALRRHAAARTCRCRAGTALP